MNPLDILKQEEERRQAVQKLFSEELTKQIDSPNVLLAHTARMGRSVSFLCTATMKWVADNVLFAHELPIFQQQLSADKKRIVLDAENVRKLRQRPLDYSRQLPMTSYLMRADHKFAPILLVLTEDWIDDIDSENWAGGKATRSAANFERLDRDGVFGRLHVNLQSQKLYALDGQHRLLAIKGLMKIVSGMPLPEMRSDGTATDVVLTREDFVKRNPELYTPQFFQRAANERVGLEIISAVNPGESYIEASQRVRSIFVHVNKMAQPVPKGHNAALNEDLGYTIVAQECLSHPALQGVSSESDGQTELLVSMDQPNLTAKSNHVTTLETLSVCAREFLQPLGKYQKWAPNSKKEVPERPNDDELQSGVADFEKLLSLLAETQVFKQTQAGVAASELREFSRVDGAHNILLRPSMQISVAGALGHLYFQAGVPWDTIAKKFLKLDSAGVFDKADEPSSYWFGLQVKADTGRMKNSPQPVAKRLLCYLMFGNKGESDTTELTEMCRSHRTVSSVKGVGSYVIGWDGERHDGSFYLPPVIL